MWYAEHSNSVSVGQTDTSNKCVHTISMRFLPLRVYFYHLRHADVSMTSVHASGPDL